MAEPQIKGPVYSVVTPFTEDDSIDFASLESYLEVAYKAGARQFYVMAYNSRYSQLTNAEIMRLNEFVVHSVRQLGSDVLTIVGDPIHCSTATSVEFCQHASSIGADLISLIVREKYYSDDQIVDHFVACSRESDVNILVHEMPFISGFGGHTINWPLSLLDRVADVERVVAIKEDAKDDQYSRDVVDLIRNRLSIVISGGGKRQWLRFAGQGCQAWLNGIGVFDPRLPIVFYDAYLGGIQEVVDDIVSGVEIPFFEGVVDRFGWHRGIKAALEVCGLMSRRERAPMVALTDDEYAVVEGVMAKIAPTIEALVSRPNP